MSSRSRSSAWATRRRRGSPSSRSMAAANSPCPAWRRRWARSADVVTGSGDTSAVYGRPPRLSLGRSDPSQRQPDRLGLAVDATSANTPGQGPPERTMPTYVYKFLDTGETIEVQQAFTDDALTEAPHPADGTAAPRAQGLHPGRHHVQGQRLLQDRQPGQELLDPPSSSSLVRLVSLVGARRRARAARRRTSSSSAGPIGAPRTHRARLRFVGQRLRARRATAPRQSSHGSHTHSHSGGLSRPTDVAHGRRRGLRRVRLLRIPRRRSSRS